MPLPMAFLTILKDSISIPANNKARFLPLIVFVGAVEGILLLLPRYGLQPLTTAVTQDSVELQKLNPATDDLDVYRASLKAVATDLGKLLAVQLACLLLSKLLLFASRSVNAFLALDALRNGKAGKKLNLTLGSIKGPFITQLTVELFNFVFFIASVALATLVVLVSRSQVVLIVVLSVVFLPLMYLEIVFQVSLIVSVDNGDVYGFAAVRRAWGLVGANRWLGIAVVGFYGAIALSFSVIYMKVFVKDASVPLWILYVLFSAVISVISQTAMASYYYICTVRARDAGEVYKPAPTTAV